MRITVFLVLVLLVAVAPEAVVGASRAVVGAFIEAIGGLLSGPTG